MLLSSFGLFSAYANAGSGGEFFSVEVGIWYHLNPRLHGHYCEGVCNFDHLCLITSFSSAIKHNNHRLKSSPNSLLYASNIFGDLNSGNCNKSPTTRTDKLPYGWDSRQAIISHNILYTWSKRIFETIHILSIRATATSEYKLRSLALPECEILGNVYPFT